MPIRADRALANLGYGSRREAQQLIRAGRVHVGADLVTDVAQPVDPARVTLDGEPLEAPGGLLVALHKPVGYVCSHSDREGATVYRLLPVRWMKRHPRPTTVGRLDKDSSGLVLVTDDHALVHALSSPKRHVEKEYDVVLDRDVERPHEIVARFAAGDIVLDGTPCLPSAVAFTGPRRASVVLTEGRHRQVRRMFRAIGFDVVTLHRTRVGDVTIGDLGPGQWAHVPRS